MKQLLLSLLFLFPALPLLSQESREDSVISAFTDGNMLMEEGRYAEALERYRSGLAIDSTSPSLLHNGGLAAFRGKQTPVAITLWSRLRDLDTNDWQAHANLVQAYQSAGDTIRRETERAALFALRRIGTDTTLMALPAYCRDQFEVAGRQVMVFEHFELEGAMALRYVFAVSDSAATKMDFRISLGSYEFTNEAWRSMENRGPEERLFHLDGYYEWGHATYGMYDPEPGYDQVRSTVIEILEGKQGAQSSSSAGRRSK